MILFLSTMEAAPWGGSEGLWKDTALRLACAGHEVSASVKYWAASPPEWADLQAGGVSVFLRNRREDPRYESHFQFLLSNRPEAAVVSTGDNGLSAIQAMEFFSANSIPYVLICHNSALFWPPDSIIDRARAGFEQARKLFFVSRRNQEYTELMMGTTFLNAKIVRNPVAVSPDASIPWPIGEVARIALVGRLDPSVKGHDLLFQVLRTERWRRRRLRVSLYGSGQNERSLRRIKDVLGLSMVEFAGTADPADIWSSEQILILPSRCEGLPLVLVEAMLAGRPAIVTDVGDNADFVCEGQTGFIAEAPEVRSLERAMENAWLRRQDWRAMGAEASRRVRTLLPHDPISTFANDLLECLGVGQDKLLSTRI